jgi:hypothetical protein
MTEVRPGDTSPSDGPDPAGAWAEPGAAASRTSTPAAAGNTKRCLNVRMLDDVTSAKVAAIVAF